MQGSRIVHFTLVGWKKTCHCRESSNYKELLNHAMEINNPHTNNPQPHVVTQKPYRVTYPERKMGGLDWIFRPMRDRRMQLSRAFSLFMCVKWPLFFLLIACTSPMTTGTPGTLSLLLWRVGPVTASRVCLLWAHFFRNQGHVSHVPTATAY